MPDLGTRLPELLRDLSTDAPAPSADEKRTVRRAKRRRIANAVSGVAVAVAVIAGSVAGVRALTPPDRRTTIGQTSTPTPSATPSFDAMWPETTRQALAAAQAQIDGGHEPWRTDAAQTAVAFATNVMGWTYGDVRAEVTEQTASSAVVAISTDRLAEIVSRGSAGRVDPRTIVQLRRLGRTDDQGAWSVARVDAPMIDISAVATDAHTVEVSGSLRYVAEPGSVRLQVRGGPAADVLSSTTTGLSPEFDARVAIPATAPTRVMVVVEATWNTGDVLAATAFPYDLPGRVVSGVLPPIAAPQAVVDTRDAIWQAVGLNDFDAMRSLMDPNTFSYNFDDGSDPIPAWKNDPSVLDPILTLLQMQPAAPKKIQGYGTFYVWPYLVDSDLDHLSASEIDDLHGLGFDDSAIEDMRRFGSYIGPRLSVDEHGLWRNYTTGGD